MRDAEYRVRDGVVLRTPPPRGPLAPAVDAGLFVATAVLLSTRAGAVALRYLGRAGR
ncbi:hypothetical protein [Nocardia stercoris]|uniref:hypothetical protein n=1 Tax=Nocardia stercoris TaxID=2483361 RepID=UPI001319D876|nr:hypothetical protein [Nocardia stercoris]